jgi:hypothetical protein
VVDFSKQNLLGAVRKSVVRKRVRHRRHDYLLVSGTDFEAAHALWRPRPLLAAENATKAQESALPLPTAPNLSPSRRDSQRIQCFLTESDKALPRVETPKIFDT